MRVEREGGNRKVAGQVFEMGVRSGEKDAGVHDEGGDAQREVEGESGKRGGEV